MNKRIGRNDVIFLVVIAIACAGLFLFYFFGNRKAGDSVVITIDGDDYGTYSLSETQEIPITIDGAITNTLTISEGRAKMTEADCPDHLCMHQKSIAKDGETIVCLPNKVVVTVVGNTPSDLDAVVQ